MRSVLALALIATMQVPSASAACRTPSARSCDSKRVGALPLDLAMKLRTAVSKKKFAKNLAPKEFSPFLDKLLADIAAASGIKHPELITIDVLPMTGYFVITAGSPRDANVLGEFLKAREIVTHRDVTFGLSQSTSAAPPPDPQWNMRIIGESSVPVVTVRSRPIIAVIDTAIETHPDLANHFWGLTQDVAFPTARPTFKCGVGSYGYSAVMKQCMTEAARAGEDHGTHISGIIGGTRNTGNGVFGV